MSFDVGDLFKKGSIAEQFLIWGVLQQLMQPFLNPLIETIGSRVWQADPNMPIPPTICAGLVNRGLMEMDKGISESSKSGTGEPQFRAMVDGAGIGPSLAEALELLRRGEIQEGEPGQHGVTFLGAMKDAGVRDDWAQFLLRLRTQIPSVAEVMNAWLEGQIEEPEARERYLLAGGDPTWFQTSYNANGTAPTPAELGELANRGIIPWEGTGPAATSFHQGILEGPTRNKWLPALIAAQQYRIPPRSITAMLHNNALTDAQALAKFRQYGMTAEDAAAMLADAHHAKAATAKELTLAQIGQLYKDAKIDRAKALQLVTALGYSSANAELLLSLQDVQKADTHVTAAINRVRALYTAHKITRAAAHEGLVELKVSAAQVDELLSLWELELGLNVKQLSAAQIVGAWDLKILTQDEAIAELGHQGWTPFDAWVLLSLHNKAPVGNKPAEGAGVGVNP